MNAPRHRNARPSLTFWAASIGIAFAAGWGWSAFRAEAPAAPNQKSSVAAALAPPAQQRPQQPWSLTELLGEENSRERTQTWNVALLEMDFPTCEAMIDELGGQPLTLRTEALLRSAWQRLGELDGPRALAKTDQIANVSLRSQMRSAVARGWTLANPETAWQRAIDEASNPTGPLAQMSLFTVANTLLEQNQADRVLAGINRIPPGRSGDGVVRGLAQQLAAYDPEQLVLLVDGLPSGSRRVAAVTGLAAEWAQSEPASAADWALSLSADESISALESVIPAWARAEGAESVVSWFADQSPSPQLDAGLLRLFSASYDWTPESAAPGLAKLSDASKRDAALQRLSFSARDNPAAQFEFASQISTERMRRSLLLRAAGQWARKAPEEAHRHIAAAAGISDEERASLLETVDRRAAAPTP